MVHVQNSHKTNTTCFENRGFEKSEDAEWHGEWTSKHDCEASGSCTGTCTLKECKYKPYGCYTFHGKWFCEAPKIVKSDCENLNQDKCPRVGDSQETFCTSDCEYKCTTDCRHSTDCYSHHAHPDTRNQGNECQRADNESDAWTLTPSLTVGILVSFISFIII